MSATKEQMLRLLLKKLHKDPKRVGVVRAGNVPTRPFHELKADLTEVYGDDGKHLRLIEYKD